MQVHLKRIDKELPLPIYQTQGAVGLDLYARTDMQIPSKTIAKIPANIIIQTPPGWMFMIASRSSTPSKKNLLFPHGIGIIDQDYSGNSDEILIQVYNFGEEEVCISRGERIAQGIFVRVEQMEFLEVEDMENENRGGFGSTGD